jgi:hypothetical protein
LLAAIPKLEGDNIDMEEDNIHVNMEEDNNVYFSDRYLLSHDFLQTDIFFFCLLNYCLLPFLHCFLPDLYYHLLIWIYLPTTDMEEDNIPTCSKRPKYSSDSSEYSIDSSQHSSDYSQHSSDSSNLATLSLMFNRRVDGADSEDSLLFLVSVVSGLFTHRNGLFL